MYKLDSCVAKWINKRTPILPLVLVLIVFWEPIDYKRRTAQPHISVENFMMSLARFIRPNLLWIHQYK